MPSNRLCVLKRTAQGHDTTWEKFDTTRDGKMSYRTNKISLRSAERMAESVSTVATVANWYLQYCVPLYLC